MTDNQLDVLLALNLRQMQGEDSFTETGVFTPEVARTCGRSNRSTATILSHMRDFGWVGSIHSDSEGVGWRLLAGGVAALERNRARLARLIDQADAAA